MGLFADLGRVLWVQSLYDDARKDPAARVEARRLLAEAAMKGDANAAAAAGDAAMIEPADYDAALYWYAQAARYTRKDVLPCLALNALNAALNIARRDDPEQSGPETAHAFAWALVYLGARNDTTEQDYGRWREALEETNVNRAEIERAISEIAELPHRLH